MKLYLSKVSKAIIRKSISYIVINAISAFVFTLAAGSIELSSNDRPPLRERIFFAGNFSLQFGTYTNIEVSPAVGVWLLPRISVAAGPTYQFFKDPIGKTDLYGGRVYSQFVVIQDFNNVIPIGMNVGLYLHAEYESLSLQRQFWQINSESGRVQVHSLLGGFGFSQPIGPRSSVTFTILWLISDHGYQIYSNPEVRVGFTF